MNNRRSTFLGLVIAGLLLVFSACGIRDESAFEATMEADRQRALWSQGQDAVFTAAGSLTDYFTRSDLAVVRYSLSSGGARRLTGNVSVSELGAADTVVFFKLDNSSGHADWWYYSCYAGTFVQVDPDFPIVRLIGETGNKEAWLYHFHPSAESVTSGECQRFTATSVQEAIITADRTTVALLSDGTLTDSKQAQISLWAFDGSQVAALDLPPANEAMGLFPLEDGQIACALGPKGKRRLMKIDVAEAKIMEWDGAGTTSAACPFILASIGEDNQPAVLQLPEMIDLAAVLALVEARNPAVNRQRALLIGAMAEEGSLGVTSLPTLQLGLDYTVAEGIFLDPIQAAGDVLTEGLVRGMIGLIQPIFDRTRREAAAKGGSIRVVIAGDLLAEEIAHQVAQASREWARYQHLAARMVTDQAVVALAEASQARYQHQLKEGIGSSAEGLRLKTERQTAANELAHNTRVLQALGQQLRLRCGLPVATVLDLGLVHTNHESTALAVPSVTVAEQRAILNRSRFLAAQSLASEVFFSQAANQSGMTGSVGARYGHVRQDDGAGVTDYIRTFIQADIPLNRAKLSLDRQRSAALVQAQRAATAAAASEVRERTRTAWLLATAANERRVAAVQELAWRQEAARIAGIWSDTGGPDAQNPTDFAALATARQNLLAAEQHLADRSVEALVATIDLHEEMGSLSEDYVHLLDRSSRADVGPMSAPQPAQTNISTWLWDASLIQSDSQKVIATLHMAACTRVYVAIGGSGELLANAAGEKSTRDFIAQAQAQGIEVFALLGEPEWLTSAATPNRALHQLSAFQSHTPGFAGLKLDVEPHALSEWQDRDRRRVLTSQWLAIIDAAHSQLPELPLWIDVHPDCVGIPGLADRVTGATFMIYHADLTETLARGQVAAATWPKVFELGIDRRPNADPGERLANPIPDIMLSSAQTFRENPRFTGIAVHDFTGLLPAQEMISP